MSLSQLLQLLLFIPKLGGFFSKLRDAIADQIKTNRFNNNNNRINQWVRNDKGKPNP